MKKKIRQFPPEHIRRNFIFFGKIAAGIFVVAIGAFFIYLSAKTPLGQSLYTRNIAQTSIIYDRTGEHVLWEMHGEEDRKILSHWEIPDTMRIATVAAEDNSFYSHHGVDFKAMIRAMKSNLQSGVKSQGASTITQQLARNAFLSREKTVKRKVLEIVYAAKIDNKYSKDQILDAYLNQVPYGSNAYGVEAAAEIFFGKSAIDLTLDEAALISALNKAPTYYSPYGDNTDDLLARQQWILKNIAEFKLADPAEVSAAEKTDTLGKIIPAKENIEAPHFVFYVKKELEKKYGSQFIEEGGLKIYTTLDWEKQKLAEEVVRKGSGSNEKKYGATNASLVAIDPKNGQILAMVGSKDFFDRSIDGEVNVTISPRQPGSSFKPFVYAKAFENGFQPETMVLDAPTDFGVDGSGKNYVPNNYDGRFHGVISMRQALAQSLNIPAIKTLREVGIDDAIEIAHRMGITTLNDRHRYGLSLVIGGGEVTLLDETSGFSVFANDGKRNPADPFLKIVDQKGKILETNKPANLPVLAPEIARKINSILSDNDARAPVFGRTNSLSIPGRTVAAKTGTTQEFRDAWTVGYIPDLAVGVWVGNNDNTPMRAGADGSYVAAPIWREFMASVIDDYGNIAFAPYEKSTEQNKFSKFEDTSGEIKVTYYKASSGKKISEKTANKLGPDKVKKKIEVVSLEGDSISEFFVDMAAAPAL